MAIEVKLPRLGKSMTEAVIVGCPVKKNDKVKKDDVLFEIETDKAALNIESPSDGFIKHILAEPGQTVYVGDILIMLGEKDEIVPAPVIEKKTTMIKVQAGSSEKKTGSDDIVKALREKPSAQSQYKLGQTIPLSRLQKITAKKMLQSKQQIPCFYLNVTADVTKLAEYREQINQKNQTKVAYNDFIIRACAIGLEKFPQMTGRLEGEDIILADTTDIGLAISVQDGLVAPIIKNAGKKNLLQIAAESQNLIEKARSGKLAPDDLQGGCLTISNLGAFGVESFIPIVIPGQCSILGIGQIIDSLIPDNGNYAIRKLMSITLSVDHKVANGAYAAQFLDFTRKLLEDPMNFE